MWDQHLYVREKLSELERLHRETPPLPPSPSFSAPRRRILGPIIGAAGRRVRRAGEALEAWGAPRTATEA